MKKTFKVIFLGTPEFAVPALAALHEHGHDIALVVTRPDRPKGRGRKLLPPPVKEAAVALGYTVVQPDAVRAEKFIRQLKRYKPDFLVVVAFGHILPNDILEIPKYGAINVHASLLPKYRGPAPIQWAIINGEADTGVTTMLMDAGLDTGDILLTEKTAITPDDTSATLHDRLSEMGSKLLITTLIKTANGDIRPIPQDHSQTTYAPLLTKKDGHINWKKSARELDGFIRGMTPWPGAYTFHDTKRLKIFSVRPVDTQIKAPPGTVIKGFPDELRVATREGALLVLEIQEASGKRLLIKNFLRGYRLPPGTILS